MALSKLNIQTLPSLTIKLGRGRSQGCWSRTLEKKLRSATKQRIKQNPSKNLLEFLINDPKSPIFMTNLESTTTLHDSWLLCLVCGFLGLWEINQQKEKVDLQLWSEIKNQGSYTQELYPLSRLGQWFVRWCLLSISDLRVWGWLLGRIDFQCWVLGKEKVENREKRGTAEHESTFWRKDKAKDWYCVYWVLEKVFYALMFFFSLILI